MHIVYNFTNRVRLFPSGGDWREYPLPLPPKLAYTSNVSPLICAQNVDFVIFMQSLAILPKMLTHNSTLNGKLQGNFSSKDFFGTFWNF